MKGQYIIDNVWKVSAKHVGYGPQIIAQGKFELSKQILGKPTTKKVVGPMVGLNNLIKF